MERIGKTVRTEDYLLFLRSKGFQFNEDAIGFIYLGKKYTSASDELTNAAIELTLKAQISFEGSFYISLLELFKANQIKSRTDAINFIRDRQLIAI